jgi:anti-sigma factor RsiW
MMRDVDEDWRLLSAYADGELDSAGMAAVEARLRAEPGLARDLDRIRDLKRGLARLWPPDMAEATPRRAAKNAGLRVFGTAVAAVLVIAAVGAVALLVWPTVQPTWLAEAMALHNRLSQATYVVDETHVAQIISSGHALEFRAPDLTASRLFLVDVVTAQSEGAETIAIHYRGMRGCRVTLVAMLDQGGPTEPPSVDDLVRTWSFGGFNFAVIAKGMDEQRFASIADYLEAAIEDGVRSHDDLRMAMKDRYDAAAPCA